jgi:hypothetical protein
MRRCKVFHVTQRSDFEEIDSYIDIQNEVRQLSSESDTSELQLLNCDDLETVLSEH